MKAHLTNIARLLLLVSIATPAISTAAPKREEAKPGSFELSLSADKTEYRVGETPDFSAILTNKSGTEALLVPALDGSGIGFRYPVVQFNIFRPRDAPPLERLGRCGNTNNLQVEDFVKVPEGGTLDPAAAWVAPGNYLFNAPGTYTITLTYDTSGKNEAWYGFMGELKNKKELDRLLAQVPIVKLTSNEVKITFTGEVLKAKVPVSD